MGQGINQYMRPAEMQLKSLYTPLPLDWMYEQLQQKQAETDRDIASLYKAGKDVLGQGKSSTIGWEYKIDENGNKYAIAKEYDLNPISNAMIQQGNNELEAEKYKAVEDYSKLMETNPNAAQSNLYAAIERLNKKKKNLVYLVGKAKENEDKFNEQDKSLMGKELYPSQLVDINMKRGDYGRAAELFKDMPIEEWEKHMYEIPDYQPGNIGKKYDIVKDALTFMKDVKPVALSSGLKHAGSDLSGDWYQYGSGNEVTRDKVAASANLYFAGNADAQKQLMNDCITNSKYRATILSIESLLERLMSACVIMLMGKYIGKMASGIFMLAFAGILLALLLTLYISSRHQFTPRHS